MSLQWSEDGLGGRNVTAPLKFKISVAQLHSKKWSLNMWQCNVHIYAHFCFQTKYCSQGFGHVYLSRTARICVNPTAPDHGRPWSSTGIVCAAQCIQVETLVAKHHLTYFDINLLLFELIPTHPRSWALSTGNEMKTWDPLFDPKIVVGFTHVAIMFQLYSPGKFCSPCGAEGLWQRHWAELLSFEGALDRHWLQVAAGEPDTSRLPSTLAIWGHMGYVYNSAVNSCTWHAVTSLISLI